MSATLLPFRRLARRLRGATAALGVLAALGPPVAADRWSALRLPELCSPPPPDVAPPALWSGGHLVLDARTGSPPRSHPRPFRMPVANVLELLEGDALRSGRSLRLHRPAPPLLARGDEEALAGAQRVLAALDAVAAAQRIELAVHLVPAFEAEVTGGGGSAVLAAGRSFPRSFPGATTWRAQARSGDPVFFGERSAEPFLATFDVQVASGSGAPDPVFGTVYTGRTLHLSAWRADGGRSVLVEGLLDHAVPDGRETFDPRDPELGQVEQPAVRVAQVAFSGLVPSGGALRVRGRGLPVEGDAWTLVVEARTGLDETASEGAAEAAGGPDAWRVLDLALVQASVAEPPVAHPGVGVEGGPAFAPAPVPLEPLTASSLWGEVELSLARDTRPRGGGRPLLAYAPGLLAGPAGNRAVWSEAVELQRATELVRTEGATLSVRAGAAEVVLPVTSGAPFRVLHGRERVALTDYRVEIATEMWLPAPVVETALDGVFVQGRLAERALPCVWWTAASAEGDELARGETTHGRVQRLLRAFRAGTAAPRVDGPAVSCAPDAAGHPDAPVLSLASP